MPETEQRPISARLVVSDGCVHCKNTLTILQGFVDQGLIGKPEIINLTRQPELAEEMGVRSVPWLQLDDLIFEGAHTTSELRTWIDRIHKGNYGPGYIGELLESGRLPLARRWLSDNPVHWQALVSLAADTQTPITTRIGIGALFEENEGKEVLQNLVNNLAELCRNPSARIRADGCFFLSLTRNPEARPVLEHCLHDSDSTVREIAEEGLDKLRPLPN